MVKAKNINKLLNITIVCQIAFIGIMILYYHLWGVQYNNSQRKVILQHIENEGIVGLTLDDCEELFGEPFLITEGEAYFEGGYFLQFELCGRYCEYELRVFFDDEQSIRNYWYECTLDVPF